MSAKELYNELIELLDETNKRVYAKEWKDYEARTFLLNLNRTIEEFEALLRQLEKINAYFKAKAMHEAIGLESQISSLEAITNYLKKQAELEEKKSSTLSKGALAEMVLSGNQRELFISIEQKVQKELLKLRYFSEKLMLFIERREEKPLPSSPGKNVLLLLEEKEKELQEAKEKLNELKAKKGVFLLEKKSAAELENEFNEIWKKLEIEAAKLAEKISETKKKLQEMNSSISFISEKISLIEELASRHGIKSAEFVMELKKERDSAREFALETEHETASLRSAYSHKALGLEKEKFAAKEEAKKELEKRFERMEKELKDKKELIERLQKIIERQEKGMEKNKKKKN